MQLGIDDPERWLANAPKRVVRTWDAYWQLEPWGQPWHRHAASMMLLHAIYRTCIGWIGGGKEIASPKFANWMPDDWSEDPEPAPTGDVVENLDNFVRAASR